jgi:hypothetical protein
MAQERMLSYQLKPSQGLTIIMLPSPYEIDKSVGPTSGPYQRITSLFFMKDPDNASVATSAYPVGYSGTEHGRLVLVTKYDFIPKENQYAVVSNASTSGSVVSRLSSLLRLVGTPDWTTFLDKDRLSTGTMSPQDRSIYEAFGLGYYFEEGVDWLTDPRTTDEAPLLTPTPAP